MFTCMMQLCCLKDVRPCLPNVGTYPRYDDNQTGGHIHLDQVVAHGALELNLQRQTGIVSCTAESVTRLTQPVVGILVPTAPSTDE